MTKISPSTLHIVTDEKAAEFHKDFYELVTASWKDHPNVGYLVHRYDIPQQNNGITIPTLFGLEVGEVTIAMVLLQKTGATDLLHKVKDVAFIDPNILAHTGESIENIRKRFKEEVFEAYDNQDEIKKYLLDNDFLYDVLI